MEHGTESPSSKGVLGLSKRRLLVVWGVVSSLWVLGIALQTWEDIQKYFGPITYVTLYVEASSVKSPVKPSLLEWSVDKLFSSRHRSIANYEQAKDNSELKELDFRAAVEELRRSPGYSKYPVKELDPSSPEFQIVREHFPSFKDKQDAELLSHVNELVLAQLNVQRPHLRSKGIDVLIERAVLSAAIPLSPLVLAFLSLNMHKGFIRRYPDGLSTYQKKVIALGFIWILGSMAWAIIQEDGDVDYAFGGKYHALFFLPPGVLVVASVLWNWANHSKD